MKKLRFEELITFSRSKLENDLARFKHELFGSTILSPSSPWLRKAANREALS